MKKILSFAIIVSVSFLTAFLITFVNRERYKIPEWKLHDVLDIDYTQFRMDSTDKLYYAPNGHIYYIAYYDYKDISGVPLWAIHNKYMKEQLSLLDSMPDPLVSPLDLKLIQ